MPGGHGARARRRLRRQAIYDELLPLEQECRRLYYGREQKRANMAAPPWNASFTRSISIERYVRDYSDPWALRARLAVDPSLRTRLQASLNSRLRSGSSCE